MLAMHQPQERRSRPLPLKVVWHQRLWNSECPVMPIHGLSQEGSFCGSGIESLRLPPDFNFMGPMACKNCKRLVQVDLICTDISAIWGVHLLILCDPGRCLAPAKAQANWQGNLSLLCLAPRSQNPAETPLSG